MIFENNSLRLKSNYNYFIILFFTIFLSFGLYISNDFGMAYDVLGYRQQGLIILNHIGNIFFPELTKKIVDEREIITVSDYFFAFSGVPFHSSIALTEKLFFDLLNPCIWPVLQPTMHPIHFLMSQYQYSP